MNRLILPSQEVCQASWRPKGFKNCIILFWVLAVQFDATSPLVNMFPD